MTRAALTHIVSEAGADAGLLLRVAKPDAAFISAVADFPNVSVGDRWLVSPRLSGVGPDAVAVTDACVIAELLPVFVRLSFPDGIRCVVVAPITGTTSILLLLWRGGQAPSDPLARLDATAFRRFAELAPLMVNQASAVEAVIRQRSVIESLDQAVVVVDDSGANSEINPAAGKLLGLEPGPVAAEDLSAALRRMRERSLDALGLGAKASELFSNPQVEVRDWIWTFRDEPTHLRVNSSPLRGPSGGRVWVFDDISMEMRLVEAERLARIAREESEARYRMLVENSTDIVFHSVEGRLVWISPSVESILGWPPVELIGTDPAQLWHIEDRTRAAALRERVYAGDAARAVARFRTRSGTPVWVEIAVRPADEPDGRKGIVGLLHDVTDRVAAETAARDSERHYRLLAENASDLVFQTDTAGTIQWVSPSVQDVLGRSPEALVGLPVSSFIHDDDTAVAGPGSEQPAQQDRVSYRARYMRADGSLRWAEVTARPILDAADKPIGRVGSLRDVHEQVLAEHALASSIQEAHDLAQQAESARVEAMEANTAKTFFLSRMSHELRTPLNAVLGFAQLLDMEDLPPQQRDAVLHIRRGGRHLLELINEVLDVSRIEAGGLSLSMEPVHVGEAVAEAVELVRPTSNAADVRLEAQHVLESDHHVWADRQRLIQILLNLLTNAIKYNRPRGAVTVEVEAREGWVDIRVRDTGIGIATEDLQRLFQPFERLGAQRLPIEGTGIGLMLSQALAAAMGGSIDVESRMGEGSTFTVCLPQAQATNASAAMQLVVPRPARTREVRVLHIEDNAANQLLMQRIVSLRPTARLVTAGDGETGLRDALSEPPDLVLLDVHLPGLRGDEVLQHLREDVRTAQTPVVIVTADASLALRQRLLELGADAVLSKPVEVNTVLSWIDDVQERDE